MTYVKHKSGVYGVAEVEVVAVHQVVIRWDDGCSDDSRSFDETSDFQRVEEFIEAWNQDEGGTSVEEVSEEEYLANKIIES